MKLTCIAIDDEPLAINIIKKYIAEIPVLQLVATCGNAIEAMEHLQNNKIDLIFLDINMPKISGINFMKNLTNPPMVIFTTAYADYAVEGFELSAIDYLLKPFSFDRFFKACSKAIEQYNLLPNSPKESQKYLFVKSDKKYFKIKIDTILYVEAYGDYVKIHTTDKMLLTKKKLTHIAQELPTHQFMQVHRSYIVSLQHVDYLEGNTVHISDVSIPVSATNKSAMLKAMNQM